MAILKTKMPNLSDRQWIPSSYSETDVPDLQSSEEDKSDSDNDESMYSDSDTDLPGLQSSEEDESDSDNDESDTVTGELPFLPTPLYVSGDNGLHFRFLAKRHAYNQCDGCVAKFRTATSFLAKKERQQPRASGVICYRDFVSQYVSFGAKRCEGSERVSKL